MVGPVGILVWQLFAGAEFSDLSALFTRLWTVGVTSAGPGAGTMLVNSLVLALGLAFVKGTASICAAYALVFFRLPGQHLIYGIILLTMFFPIETRILPTFAIASQLNLLNSYSGMILPVAASGLGVLVFRQYFKQIPQELIEAARLDGSNPVKILIDIVIPLSLPMIAALFAILFVLGWNQYVWPVMLTTTSQDHATIVSGMNNAGFGGRSGNMLALLALIPPAIVVLALQRWLVRGLTSGIH